MDRSIALLLIGLVFGGGIGFVAAAGNGITLDGHDHGDASAHAAHAGHDSEGATAAPGRHAHGAPLRLAAGPDAPTVEVTLTPDPMSGWNLRIAKSGFRFAPENASRAHVAGEGHAHVYINGKKLARLYGDWMHLSDLPSGETTIKVGLYTNDHRPIFVNGAPVSDAAVLTVN